MIHQANSKPSTFNKLATGSLFLVGCLLAFTGCQSQTFSSGFTSANRTSPLSKLAFWKQEAGPVPPPPPAQHLDPSSSQQLNQLASQTGSTTRDLVDQHRRQIDNLAQGIASKSSSLSSSPLRSPYPEAGASVAKTAQDLKASLNSARGKSIDQGLAAVTEKLQASAPKGFKTLKESLPKPSSNQFEAALAQTNSQLQSKLTAAKSSGSNTKNTFAAAAKKSGSATKDSFAAAVKNSGSATKNSLAKVNNSLYDARGNLTSRTKTTIGSIDQARQRFTSALGSAGDKAALAAAKPSNDFAGALKDKLASTASTIKAPLSGGSFNPPVKAAVDPLANQSRALLDRAKAKVAGLGTGFDFPEPASRPAAVPQFKAPVAAKTISGGQFGGGQFAAKPPATTSFNQNRVASVTPVQAVQSSFGQRVADTSTALGSKLTNAWNNGTRQSQLKAIQVGAPTTNPGNVLRTASLEASDFGKSASIPSAFGASRNITASHVSDIYIPEKVLSGSSNYAPGSVNKVR